MALLLPVCPHGSPDVRQGARAARADLPRDAARACRPRLALHPWITNVQASWVKLGLEGSRQALRAGVNDLGGTLMNESISRSAGAEFGQELAPEAMEELIRSADRVPRQRTTLYGEPPEERVRASFGAPPVADPINPRVKDAGLVAPPRLVAPGSSARAGGLDSSGSDGESGVERGSTKLGVPRREDELGLVESES